MKYGVFYLNLQGEDAGIICPVEQTNTIDEAEDYMTRCANAYSNCLNLHHPQDLYGVQGKDPIAIMRDGTTIRLYYIDFLEY